MATQARHLFTGPAVHAGTLPETLVLPVSPGSLARLEAIGPWPAHLPSELVSTWLAPEGPFLSRGAAAIVLVGDRAGWLLSHDPAVQDEPFVAFSGLRVARGCEGDERAAILAALVAASRSWALERGVKRLLGPIFLNTWLPYRVLERDWGPVAFPFPGETVEPPHRQEDYRLMGLEVTDRFVSRYLEKRNPPWWWMDLVEKWLRRGARVTIRTLESGELPPLLPAVYRLVLETFSRNAHFSPIAPTEFASLLAGGPTTGAIHLGAFDPEGALVGFCTGHVHEGVGILKTVGVGPSHRNTRLGMGLTFQFHRELLKRGLGQAVHALMKDDNASNRMSGRVARTMRTYVLHGCTLD
jgi:hypothetical protein